MRTFLLVIALVVNLLYIALSLFGIDTWLGIKVGAYNALFGLLILLSFVYSLVIFLRDRGDQVGAFQILSVIVVFLSVGTFGWYIFMNILGLFMGGW